MNSLKNRLLLGLLMGLLACGRHTGPQVRAEERTTRAGKQYSLFYPQNLAIGVVTSRPDVAGSACLLSVAAAYTDLETSQPLDLLVSNGQLLQAKAKVGFLDGLLTIAGDTITISRIAKGQSPASPRLAAAQRQHGTVLLQELLVLDGQNLRPAGGSFFQRRALAEFADHRFAVVESAADDCTMQQFGDDLVELGAKNALYLDMGDWDEGWYKDGQTVVRLGHRRTATPRQSNWLVFVTPATTR